MSNIKATEKFASAPAQPGSPVGLFLDHCLDGAVAVQVTLSDGRTAMQLTLSATEALATAETLKAMLAQIGAPTSAVRN